MIAQEAAPEPLVNEAELGDDRIRIEPLAASPGDQRYQLITPSTLKECTVVVKKPNPKATSRSGVELVMMGPTDIKLRKGNNVLSLLDLRPDSRFEMGTGKHMIDIGAMYRGEYINARLEVIFDEAMVAAIKAKKWPSRPAPKQQPQPEPDPDPEPEVLAQIIELPQSGPDPVINIPEVTEPSRARKLMGRIASLAISVRTRIAMLGKKNSQAQYNHQHDTQMTAQPTSPATTDTTATPPTPAKPLPPTNVSVTPVSDKVVNIAAEMPKSDYTDYSIQIVDNATNVVWASDKMKKLRAGKDIKKKNLLDLIGSDVELKPGEKYHLVMATFNGDVSSETSEPVEFTVPEAKRDTAGANTGAVKADPKALQQNLGDILGAGQTLQKAATRPPKKVVGKKKAGDATKAPADNVNPEIPDMNCIRKGYQLSSLNNDGAFTKYAVQMKDLNGDVIIPYQVLPMKEGDRFTRINLMSALDWDLAKLGDKTKEVKLEVAGVNDAGEHGVFIWDQFKVDESQIPSIRKAQEKRNPSAPVSTPKPAPTPSPKAAAPAPNAPADTTAQKLAERQAEEQRKKQDADERVRLAREQAEQQRNQRETEKQARREAYEEQKRKEEARLKALEDRLMQLENNSASKTQIDEVKAEMKKVEERLTKLVKDAVKEGVDGAEGRIKDHITSVIGGLSKPSTSGTSGVQTQVPSANSPAKPVIVKIKDKRRGELMEVAIVGLVVLAIVLGIGYFGFLSSHQPYPDPNATVVHSK